MAYCNRQVGHGDYNIVLHLYLMFHSHFHPPFLVPLQGPSHETILSQEVCSLLCLGAIDPVPSPHRWKGFYSKYFLVPKEDERAGVPEWESQGTIALHFLPAVRVSDREGMERSKPLKRGRSGTGGLGHGSSASGLSTFRELLLLLMKDGDRP